MHTINRITLFFAKSRLTWLPFMLLLTGLMVLNFVFIAALSVVKHFYAEWNYEWRYEWAQWFGFFTDRHRRRLHTLALGSDAAPVCETSEYPPLIHLPSLAAGEHEQQTLQ